MKKNFWLLIAAFAFSSAVWAAGWRVGVFAESAQDFEAARAMISSDGDAELVNLRNEEAADGGLAALVAASQAMSAAEVKRCEDYATAGGLLIVMGNAGEYDDADGDGKRSPGEKRVWALSNLCGLSRSGAIGAFEFVRFWLPHPLFLRFPSSAPVEWEASRPKAVFAICQTARPLASGFFAPQTARTVNGLPAHGWHAATRLVGESAYLALNRAGKGVTLFVAENLVTRGLTPAQQALARSLLSPLADTLRSAAMPEPPPLGGATGNLIRNGDMETRCVITDPMPKNTAPPPFPFPLGWQHNAWGGGGHTLTLVQSGNGWAMAVEYTGAPGEAAGAVCVPRYFHPTFRPQTGQEYTLAFRIKSGRAARLSLWGKLEDGKPWRIQIGEEPPAEEWRDAIHVFRPPAAIFAGSLPQFGCHLDFTLAGPGRTELDDVTLKQTQGMEK